MRAHTCHSREVGIVGEDAVDAELLQSTLQVHLLLHLKPADESHNLLEMEEVWTKEEPATIRTNEESTEVWKADMIGTTKDVECIGTTIYSRRPTCLFVCISWSRASPGQVDLHLLPLDVVGPLLQQRRLDDGLQGGQRHLLPRQNNHHGHVLALVGHLQHLVDTTRLL